MTNFVRSLWNVCKTHAGPGDIRWTFVSTLLSHWTHVNILSPGEEVEEEVTHLHVAGQSLHHSGHLVSVRYHDTPAAHNISWIQQSI